MVLGAGAPPGRGHDPAHRWLHVHSAPVSRDGQVVGVVQISRKGTLDARVADFTSDDLRSLVHVADELAGVL